MARELLSGLHAEQPDRRQDLGRSLQRSTIVLYWNKELFKEAGLDPEKAPATWQEQLEFAQKLTKRDSAGNVSQWGIQIPSSGFPYWLFQALATQVGAILMNPEGTQTFYNAPASAEALLGFPNFLAALVPTPYWYCLFATIPLGCAAGIRQGPDNPHLACEVRLIRFELNNPDNLLVASAVATSRRFPYQTGRASHPAPLQAEARPFRRL